MDSESFLAENSPPVIPPPLLEPVPPPIVYSEERSALWRLNDRMALVAGGLTLILLGVIVGRVMGPQTASEGSGEFVAAVEAFVEPTQSLPLSLDTSFLSDPTAEEINPPELVVTPVSARQQVEVTEPVPAALLAAVSRRAVRPSEIAKAATATNVEAVDSAEAANQPAAVFTSPVSIEGQVATIKLPGTTQVCGLEKATVDRKLNTALTWAESVSAANQRAEEEGKLIFLIHVSGNFEMPGFT